MTGGKGGMSTTDDPDLTYRAGRFWDYGRTTGYNHVDLGHSFRMTSPCAALGDAQFDGFPAFTIAQTVVQSPQTRTITESADASRVDT